MEKIRNNHVDIARPARLSAEAFVLAICCSSPVAPPAAPMRKERL
jgi:hypothetical protein